MKKLFFICFLSLFQISITAQDQNIVNYLKQIENGNRSKAEEFVKAAGSNHNNPSIYFLEAVLTPNGESALERYLNVYENYPHSAYADASLFRIFSYYYALGYYKRAESYLDQLKEFYPKSPYIKMTNRDIPDEDLVVEKEEITPVPKDETEYKFTVQAGAFLNLDNAKKLMSDFKSDGYACEIQTKDVGGSILNVVLVGKFIERSQTGPLLEHLKNKYKINGRVAVLN